MSGAKLDKLVNSQKLNSDKSSVGYINVGSPTSTSKYKFVFVPPTNIREKG